MHTLPVLVTIGVLTTLCACTGSTPVIDRADAQKAAASAQEPRGDTEQGQRLLTQVFEPSAAVYRRTYNRLADYLPNVRHTSDLDPSGTEETATDNVVLGRVTRLEPDRGFVNSLVLEPGRPGAAEVPHDDPTADWRSVRVQVAVDEALYGEAEGGSLTFWLRLDGNAESGQDAAAAEQALRELGTVVVFSKGRPRTPEYLGLQRVLPDEQYGLAVVDPSGRLSFPFADGSEGPSSSAFLSGLDTVDKLRRELAKPNRVAKN